MIEKSAKGERGEVGREQVGIKASIKTVSKGNASE